MAPLDIDEGESSNPKPGKQPEKPYYRSHIWDYCETCIVQMLEFLLGNKRALEQFKQINGKETALRRLRFELENAEPQFILHEDTMNRSNMKKIEESHQALIFSLIWLVAFCLNDHNDSFNLVSDSKQTSVSRTNADVLRSSYYSETLSAIFRLKGLTSPFIAAGVSLLKDAISGDPAPPAMLNFFLGNRQKVMLLAWEACTDPSLEQCQDTLTGMIDLVNALSLIQGGIQFIKQTNLFDKLFVIYRDFRYLSLESNVILCDVPTVLGDKLQDLLHHYPDYQENCFIELLTALNLITRPKTIAWEQQMTREFIQQNDFNVNQLFSLYFHNALDKGKTIIRLSIEKNYVIRVFESLKNHSMSSFHATAVIHLI
jgi:hypothetical protein